MARIASIQAREVLDSRGNPTVEVDVFLEDGARGRAIVPSGASTGQHEALELRDVDSARYVGRGVRNAVQNVEQEIAPILAGLEAGDQRSVDQQMIALDGTRSKSRLGANALLGVSMAVARAAAASARLPLYRYLGGQATHELPVPMVNILSGGIHGGGNFDFQDFMVIPLRARRFSEALEDAVAVYRAMKGVLQRRGVYSAGVADEGGYAPRLQSNEAGFQLMVEAFERAGLEPGKDVAIAVDVAASHFCQNGNYALAAEGPQLSTEELIERLEGWVCRYPVACIEDGLAEEDWEGWRVLTQRLGERCQLVGDDLFVTHRDRLLKGIAEGAGNSILVKMNQVGTLTETLEVTRLAQQNGYRTVVSARSGETEDDSLADLAAATAASQIKIGSIARSERLAKYNRLLRIEKELGA
jgi:enolase